MERVAPIKLQYSPKTLWFDAQDYEVKRGDRVIVTTARGREIGRCVSGIIEVEEAEIKKLNSKLQPMLRIATEEDEVIAREMQVKSDDALPVYKKMALELAKDMHPIAVEFLFDGEKAVFYFESEDRIDFRELVRKLASLFHVRIDMRQVGVRDEARMIGGLGHCGKELCCKRLGCELCPVSIRMAKEQGLSLNPQKISGTCGRLMCCLRHEFDAYKDFRGRAPKVGQKVETPRGEATVSDLKVPREVVVLTFEDNKTIKIPLNEIDKTPNASCPYALSEEVLEKHSKDPLALFEVAEPSLRLNVDTKSTPLFDKEKDQAQKKSKKAKVRPGQKSSGLSNVSSQDPHKPRRTKSVKKESDKSEGSQERKSSYRKARRGSHKVSTAQKKRVPKNERY
jgi:cell fate regulator YaaT (PSP1 superfamily)